MGFGRFWVSEMHGSDTAWATPAALLGAIGARTSRIRFGTATMQLALRPAIATAELFAFLTTAFPDRIDCGLGGQFSDIRILRSFVGPKATASYLSDEFEATLKRFFRLYNRGHPHRTLYKATPPYRAPIPEIWLMGIDGCKRRLASKYGTNLCYSCFHSRSRLDPDEISRYRDGFNAVEKGSVPRAAIAIAVICAATPRKVRSITDQVKPTDRRFVLTGTPPECFEQICGMAEHFHADEVVLNILGTSSSEVEASIELIGAELKKHTPKRCRPALNERN